MKSGNIIAGCMLLGLSACATMPQTSPLVPSTALGAVRIETNISGGHYDGVRMATPFEDGTVTVKIKMLEIHPDPKWPSVVNVFVAQKGSDEKDEMLIRFEAVEGFDAIDAYVDTYLHGDRVSRADLGNVSGLVMGNQITVSLVRIDAHHMRYSVNDSPSILATETPFSLDYIGTTTSGAHSIVTIAH